MSPLTKCETIAPNPEINEIRFSTHWSWCTCRFVVQKNGIDRSRNAWKRRTSFAPTQGLHISGYVPRKHRYCNSHISSYEWKIWIITRQLRVYVTLLFAYFSHPYSLKQWKLISDNTFHKLLKCKPCVGTKLVLRFQALITPTLLDRSILFLYRQSACTSGSISRRRISFISRFGTIVSYFVKRGHFILLALYYVLVF